MTEHPHGEWLVESSNRRDARRVQLRPLVSRRLGVYGVSCPRISPFGFFAVCTFTYAPPDVTALSVAAESVEVPCTPDLHLAPAHSATATLPALPALPRWMWAAIAGPVSFANVSFQTSLLPVSVPVNEPDPFAFLTTWAGTSAFAVSFAEILIEALEVALAMLVNATLASATAATAVTSLVDLMLVPFSELSTPLDTRRRSAQ